MVLMPALFAFVAYSLWSFTDALVKYASGYGATTYTAMTFIGFGTVLFLLLKNKAQRRSLKDLRPNNLRIILLRSLLSMVASFGYVTAYINLPLAQVYVVEFIAPFLITLGAAYFMKEHVSFKKILVIAVGFVGACVSVVPELLDSLKEGAYEKEVLGYAAVLLAVICFSAVQLLSRKIVKTESPNTIIGIASLFIGVFGLVMAKFSFAGLLWPAFVCLLFCVVTNSCGALAMLHAHKIGSAANVSVLHYWQLVMGGILGFFVWNDVPTIHLVAGAVLVVVAGIYMVRLEQKEKLYQKVLESSAI